MSDLTQGTPNIEFELWISSIFENLGAPLPELEKVKQLARGLDHTLPPTQSIFMQEYLKEKMLQSDFFSESHKF